MVRHRLPSSTYYTPAGESEWCREKFGEQSIAVLSDEYRAPIDMARHVADHVLSQHPFFIMDVAAVQRRYEALRMVSPRLRMSYSVAYNADPVLARILANHEEMSFVVANTPELELASLHIEPARIIMCSQLLTRKTIRNAAQIGCGTFVIESEKQLQDVLSASPESEILLAVNLQYSNSEIPFGCCVDDVESIIDLAHFLNANLSGIYFELGSQTSIDDNFCALHDARSIFDTASAKFVDLKRIAIGSLTIPTQGDVNCQNFVQFCSSLNKTVDELFETNVDVSVNFGQFLVKNAFTLCTNVIGKKALDSKFITNDAFDDGVGFIYQTNDGVYGSFGCRQMDINPLCKPLHASDVDEPQHFGTIIGPTLDGTDIAQQLMKSRQLRVGEWLVWEQMGAFTIPVDSEHPVPPVYYYSGRECWQKLVQKEEERRSPSPIASYIDEMGSDCEGYASSSCDEFECDVNTGIFE